MKLFVDYLGFLPISAFFLGTVVSLLITAFLYYELPKIFNLEALRISLYLEILITVILMLKLLKTTIDELGIWGIQSAKLLARNFEKAYYKEVKQNLEKMLSYSVLRKKAKSIGYDIPSKTILDFMDFIGSYPEKEGIYLEGPGYVEDVNLARLETLYKELKKYENVKKISLINMPQRYYQTERIPLIEVETKDKTKVDFGNIKHLVRKTFLVRKKNDE